VAADFYERHGDRVDNSVLVGVESAPGRREDGDEGEEDPEAARLQRIRQREHEHIRRHVETRRSPVISHWKEVRPRESGGGASRAEREAFGKDVGGDEGEEAEAFSEGFSQFLRRQQEALESRRRWRQEPEDKELKVWGGVRVRIVLLLYFCCWTCFYFMMD
jgi:type VI protein secretion system component VasF